jgi:aerobic C4-dicarboxylate transport protein
VADYAAKAHESSVTGFLLGIIPDTLISAFAEGNILQVLFVAVVFGVALALCGEAGAPILAFRGAVGPGVPHGGDLDEGGADRGLWRHGLHHRQIRAGQPGASGGAGGHFLSHLADFVLGVLGVVGWLAGFSILRLIAYLKAELLLVLGTSSSESALPRLIEKMEAAGCPRAVVALVVPTGYSFNLDGTNIYMTLAALFIAQACNVDLTLGQQALLLGVAMLSSKGAAGVTGAGFITLAATLAIVPSCRWRAWR